MGSPNWISVHRISCTLAWKGKTEGLVGTIQVSSIWGAAARLTAWLLLLLLCSWSALLWTTLLPGNQLLGHRSLGLLLGTGGVWWPRWLLLLGRHLSKGLLWRHHRAHRDLLGG